MSRIAENITRLRSSLPEGVELVAVSKFHPPEAIMEAYTVGQRVFGESRVMELVEKAQTLPKDIKWYFIGHLQTNKVRRVIPYVNLIQSIDSERLLNLVDAEAERIGRKVNVLLQLHVAQEETKFGFAPEELYRLAESGVLSRLHNVNVAGVMGMASNTDDKIRIKADFDAIKSAFDQLSAMLSPEERKVFKIISMGMSDDYESAIESGSTMVRIGSDIFGERQY